MRFRSLLAKIAPIALAAAEPDEFFETRVRPVFARNCYVCHTDTHLGGLEVNSRQALLKGGNSGPAIVPGKPGESLLVQAVNHTHAKLKMPPSGRLREEEIRDLTEWVQRGAPWPETAAPANAKQLRITEKHREFWSFRPIRKSEPPAVKNVRWARTAIDRFILAKLEEKSLEPARPAEKSALIRRAYFDLIGLPPTPAQVDAFARDESPGAFAKVVDHLLESAHYGERWGRHWLDIARYGDEKLASTRDDPYPNAFRYRDWVVKALNDDMPYDLFVKAQIAADLMPAADRDKYLPGLGFYGLSPEFQDDRVDVTTRGFMALTVACAQCHDHKYDPLPTKDFYALQGVFSSSRPHEYPLAAPDVVEKWQARKKRIDTLEKELKEFLKRETEQVGDILAGQIARYLMATARTQLGRPLADKLDPVVLERFRVYFSGPREHPYLKRWDELVRKGATGAELQKEADTFQALALEVIREKRELTGQKKTLDSAKAILWKDLYFATPRPDLPYRPPVGLLYFGEVAQYPLMEREVIRFLHGDRRQHVERLIAEIDNLQASLPPQYPFLNGLADSAKPSNQKVRIGGNAETLGEEVPRRFLEILSGGEPKPFSNGSGRLELAEAIASPSNPLTARVMMNRVWQYHFGEGLVRTPGNFGQLGERPTHPELLDYLAAQFIERGWSLKAMHREIMLSAVYQVSSVATEKHKSADGDNRLLAHAHRRRLDAEALRDSLLFVSGRLDSTVGGPPVWLTENYATQKGPDGEADKYSQAAEWITGLRSRRTLYGYVARRRPDQTMALFDFPSPSSTADRRFTTSTPLQRLFFLNSDFVARQAEGLAAAVKREPGDEARIRRIYKLLYARDPLPEELAAGREFLRGKTNAWPEYAQVLLASNEFLYIK